MNHTRLMTFLMSFFLAVFASTNTRLFAASEASTALSRAEARSGWKLLFDGQTTKGWRGFKKDAFPTQGWQVRDGALYHAPKGGGGDIITTDRYQNFELQWEWKVAPGANSGLKYFIIEERGSPIGHEYQMIDDELHSDAKTGPLHQTAAFYDVLPPRPGAVKKAGEWNRSSIVVRGNRVEHRLNGQSVLRYEMGSKQVVEGIARSKFKNVSGFGTSFPGHILLQDHGDEVWFRNIRIRAR